MDETLFTQSVSFKVWLLNYLQQNCGSVDFLQLADDFDKITDDTQGFESLNQRLNISSLTDFLTKDYKGLVELDDNGQLNILKSGESKLNYLLTNCRACASPRPTRNSTEGFCLSHAIENLITWTAGPPIDYKSSSNGNNKEQSNYSRSSSFDEQSSSHSSSKEQYNNYEEQCRAFKIWFLNLLSINEGLNIGQINSKFTKEIKSPNWFKQFGYQKLYLLISKEMNNLVFEKNEVFKMTDAGKQALIKCLSNCGLCAKSASSMNGLCLNHAIKMLRQWTELKNVASPVVSTIKQRVDSFSSTSSAFSRSDTRTSDRSISHEPPSVMVSFKVWLLDILYRYQSPLKFSDLKGQLSQILRRNVDSFYMYHVKDISALIRLRSFSEFITNVEGLLHITYQGEEYLNYLVNNCFYCNTGWDGVCYSHALEDMKNWKVIEKAPQNIGIRTKSNASSSTASSSSNTKDSVSHQCLALKSFILDNLNQAPINEKLLSRRLNRIVNQAEFLFERFTVNSLKGFIQTYMPEFVSIGVDDLCSLTSEGSKAAKNLKDDCKECFNNQKGSLCAKHGLNVLQKLNPRSGAKVICTVDLSKDVNDKNASGSKQNPSSQPAVSIGQPVLQKPTLNDSIVPVNNRSAEDLREFESLELLNISPEDSRYLTIEHINSVARDCIQQLAQSNDHVSMAKIVSCLLNRFQVKSLNMLNTSLKKAEDIPCIFKHTRDLCRVNAYIQAFLSVRSIATIYELYECLKDYKFDSLELGPFIRLPILYDYFKIPNDLKKIPQIETKDIILNLKEYMNMTKKWNERVDMPDFLNFLIKQYKARNGYDLGVQIRSIALATQVLKKAQRDEKNLKVTIEEQMNFILQSEMTGYLENFRRHLTDCSGNLTTMKQHLFTKPVMEVLENLLETYEIMLTGLLDERRKRTYKAELMAFRSTFKNDPVLAHLFTLAVCCSCDENLDEVLERIQTFFLGTRVIPNKNIIPEEKEKPKNLPPESEVIAIIKNYLEGMLDKGQLTLKHLSQIETKLFEKFKTSFDDLGCGTFLECLIQQPKLLQMLDEAGCSSLGLSSSLGGESKHRYFPSFQEVLSFLHQFDSNLSQDIMSAALCNYYGIADIKFLNYGSISRLLKSDKSNQSRQPSNIIYEMAITTSGSTPLFDKKTVGLLGSKSIDEALNCLENCPLMEDLKTWSHWELVFKPELGDLKQFIQKYGHGGRHGGIRRHPLLVMEVQPGKLLKLTNDSTDELFSNAACAGDIRNTCGHLVSLIALNGVQNSLALWSTRIKVALVNIYEKEAERDDPDKNPDLIVCRFVLGCLMLIPRRICHAVASKVFLDPLSTFGANQSKQLLLQCCTNSEELGILQELGMVLVIQEWSGSFNDRVKLIQPSMSSQIDESKEFSQDEYSDEEVDKPEPSETGDVSDLDNLLDEENMIVFCEDEDSATVVEKHPDKLKDMEIAEKKKEIEITNQCKVIVEVIRKEEFGVGLELTGDAAALLRCHEERLGRSLDRLSKDLYSRDTHFVLELIQNADDNTYPPEYIEKDAKIEPAIKFVLHSDKIIILNNECGFLEKNIRALCDVGKSTKGKHMAGYIGQKGIGFKSVFRVTDQPEIHSAGFHFRFDVNSGPMGYIIPHWVEDTDPQEGWTTKIVLPLKNEFQIMMKQRGLLAQFQDIHSSLLIFLHRLRNISIVNEVDNNQVEMKRKDLDSNLIELSSQDTKCQWLVIKKTLDASKMKAHGGVEVEATELALAFPLMLSDDIKVLPPRQKVFAFLPLRSYGFRFILQADFEVPSSREDIDIDSPWNQWLRNEVHILFCEGIQYFRDLPSINSVEAVCYFLQFVPFEDEILDFFRPVTSGIHKLLRAKPCLPIINDEKTVEWKIPIQVVIPGDSFTQEVILPSLIKQTLDLYYIHPQVMKNVSSTLLTSLGVQKLDASHLISIGLTLASDLQKNKDILDTVRKISNWMICLFRTLDEIQNENVLDPIKTIPIIPLANGKLVTIADNCIFFPVKLDKLEESDKKILSVIEKELNIVHADLVNCEDDIKKSQVVKLLEMIGIKPTIPKEIIYGHIIPAFQSDSWKTKSKDTLIAYVVYIKQHLANISHVINLDELKGIIQILTNNGFKNPLQESIHFTTDYVNPIDLPKKLEGFKWTLLDRCYLKFSNSKDGVYQWRTFFSDLGVLNSLAVKNCTFTHTSKTLKSSTWSSVCDDWPESETYIIKDYVCDQFLALTTKNEVPSTLNSQMAALVELLDYDWNNYFIKMMISEVCNGEGHVIHTTESSFSLSLKQLSWLPGEHCIPSLLEDGKVKIVFEKELWPVSELFKVSDEAKDLLSIHVPYLNASLSSTSLFAQYIGLKQNVDLDLIKKLLISWCQRKDNTTTTFITSLSHMEAIYRYLWKHSTPVDLQDIFANHPIIFVPLSLPSDSKFFVCGQFLNKHEVFWNEPSGILTKFSKDFQNIRLRKDLSEYYPELHRIFLECALVSSHPSINEYVAMLAHMSNIRIQFQMIIDDVRKLYLTIYEKFIIKSSSKQSLAEVKMALHNKKLFLTTTGIWVSLEDKPMIADDKELVELFLKERGVYLLDFTESNNGYDENIKGSDEAVIAFFKACGIEKLSECVTSKLETELFQPCPTMQEFIHEVTPFIQMFLWNKLPNIYKELKVINIKHELTLMHFAQVNKLYVRYTLKHRPSLVVIRDQKCALVNDRDLYIQEKFHDNHHLICGQLVLFFIRGHPDCLQQLRLFLSAITPAIIGLTKESPSEFMTNQSYQDLPADEERWFVPMPTIIPLEIIPPVSPPPDSKVIIVNESKGKRGLSSWPPQAPNRGSSQKQIEKNVTKQNYQDTDKTRAPPVKVSEFKEKSSITKSSDRDSILGDKRKRHLENDVQNSKMPRVSSVEEGENISEETNENEGISDEQQQIDETTQVSAEDKAVTSTSSLPNEKQDFPNYEDHSVVHFSDKEGDKYMKIYHPRTVNRQYPVNELEVEFEELSPGKKLEIPKVFESNKLESKIAIGRYGEHLVYDFLRSSLFYPGSDIKIAKLDWMNESGESEYPFDLKVSLENGFEIFIEVKTTKSNHKEVFEVSVHEVQFAQAKKDGYHLFRVFNAGNNDKIRLVFLRDLASKLENHSVKLCMVI